MTALKGLSGDEMIALSRPWRDPKQQRPLLEKYETVAPLLKKLDAIDERLIHNQPAVGGNARLSAIKTEELAVDTRHDRKLGGAVGLIDALIQLSDDADLSAQLLGLRGRLVPDGLGIIHGTYLAESGAAARSAGRLTDVDLKVMQATPLPHGMGTLHTQYEHYLQAGRKLGELEGERAKVEAAPSGPSASDALKDRNAWIAVVNAIVGALATEVISTEDDTALFGPLRKAQAGLARAGKASSSSQPDPASPASVPAEPAAKA
jgi:hypothetical protein